MMHFCNAQDGTIVASFDVATHRFADVRFVDPQVADKLADACPELGCAHVNGFKIFNYYDVLALSHERVDYHNDCDNAFFCHARPTAEAVGRVMHIIVWLGLRRAFMTVAGPPLDPEDRPFSG